MSNNFSSNLGGLYLAVVFYNLPLIFCGGGIS